MSHLRYSVFDTSSKTPLKNNHMRIFETAFLETESTWVEARRAATEAEESGFKKLAGAAE